MSYGLFANPVSGQSRAKIGATAPSSPFDLVVVGRPGHTGLDNGAYWSAQVRLCPADGFDLPFTENGDYEAALRSWGDRWQVVLETVAFVVGTSPPASPIVVTALPPGPGFVGLSFMAPPDAVSPVDWLGAYPKGGNPAVDWAAQRWVYTGGALAMQWSWTTHSSPLGGLAAGDWTLAYYLKNGFEVAASVDVTVP